MRTNINESNVDQYIQELINRTKGRYITQGVSFNKTCPRQLRLLRNALLESSSFSGLAKEMLALRYTSSSSPQQQTSQQPIELTPKQENKAIDKEMMQDWL